MDWILTGFYQQKGYANRDDEKKEREKREKQEKGVQQGEI